MLLHYILKTGKTLLLALVLFTIIGCVNISARPVQSESGASKATVKINNNLNNRSSNSEKGEKVSDVTTGNTEKVLKKEYGYHNGDKYLAQYESKPLVRQIILVEQSATEVSVGKLYVLIKGEKGNWKEYLQCKAYLGKNGINKGREGDVRTPAGDFGMLMAFGAKEDPGSLIPYTKLTDTMYLCGDKEYYNQFIDVSKTNHRCSGNSEHLLSYIPQYNYALFFDYNKENIYGKGSAIFLHCFGNYPFTMGCIAVAEENMVKILRTVNGYGRICIYAGK